MDHNTSPVRSSWATVVAAIATATTALGVIAILITNQRIAREAHEMQVSQAEAIRQLQQEIRGQKESTTVEFRSIPNECIANNTEFSCTFTNLSDKPVSTCARGLLTQKEAKGVRLASLPACTGRLEPQQTRTVSAPWNGGFAKNICSTPGRFGDQLDWEKCEFTTEPIVVAAATPADAVVPAKSQ
jgi:hypothetical protein